MDVGEMKQKPIFDRWQTVANDYILVFPIFLSESVKLYAFFFVPRCYICIKYCNGYSAILNHGFYLFGQLEYILLTEKAWTHLNSISEDSLKMGEIPCSVIPAPIIVGIGAFCCLVLTFRAMPQLIFGSAPNTPLRYERWKDEILFSPLKSVRE